MKQFLIFTLSYFSSLLLFSQDSVDAVLVNEIIPVDIETVIYYEEKTFDLLYQPAWFESDSLIHASIYKQKQEIKEFTEEEIKAKLELIPTTFPLNYNHVVKQSIERFAENRRLLISQSLGLGEHYFPLFEESLSRHNVPLVFKYLPVIESNLNPFARSGAGAQGMWQFMIRTGKSFGLEVNDYYDERCDPLLSTEAAATYLSDLYKIYGDWQLVLAAYNCGPGNVNKAIGQAGGKRTYWEIRPYLPKETRDYVPRLIACIFVMTYPKDYDILAKRPSQDLFQTDTFLIKDKLTIQYICELTGLDSTYLQFVNPALKTGVIPKTENGFSLNIPYNFLGQFAALQDFLRDDPYLANIEAEVLEVVVPKYVVYKVKSGDTLGHIAMKYGVGVSKIKKWNSLKSDNLKIGQKLVLYV